MTTTPVPSPTAQPGLVGPRRRGTTGDREFLLLAIALTSCGALAIDTILPAFADVRVEYGMPADATRVGWLITAFFLGMAVGPWIFGPASDRFGRRRPLQAGLLLYICGAVLAALAPTWPLLVASRVLWGIGAAAPRTLSVAIIRDRYEGDAMAHLMSIVMAVFLLVPVVAPAIGASLIAVLPWRAVFWFPAAMAVLLLWWTRRLPETLTPDRRRPFTVHAVSQAGREVLRYRQTWALTVAMTFVFGVVATFLAQVELIVDEVYDLAAWFPLAFAAVAVLFALNSLNNARLVRRFGAVHLARGLSVLAVTMSLVLVLVAFVSGGVPAFGLFVVAMALAVAFAQGLPPTCNAIAMGPVPHVAGTASAIVTTVTVAGGAVLGSAVNARFDNTVRPFAVGVALFVGIAASLVWWATASLAPMPPSDTVD